MMNEENNNISDEARKDIGSYKNYSTRSDIAQEIINRKPGFVERWALLCFLAVFILLFIGAWFVEYPDTVSGRAILIGENAPKEIVSNSSGSLVKLFVQNNQYVKEGEMIGWIKSNSDAKEVIELSRNINEASNLLNSGQFRLASNLFNVIYSDLGDIQTSYEAFIAQKQKFDDYVVNGFIDRRKILLKKDIAALNTIKEKASAQKTIIQKDNELSRKTFEMNEQLYKEKVISTDEYRQAQSKLLNNNKNIPGSELNVLIQENILREKQKEIEQLSHDVTTQESIFRQALYTLKSNVDSWIRLYTIPAPSEGYVIFVTPLQQNQYIQQNKIIGYISPKSEKYFVEVNLSQTNIGKIDTGMKVMLRFDAYPYLEMGFVPGRLTYLSKVPIDSGFVGWVIIENGLITNLKKKLQYKNGLMAEAIIITKDMRLLERIYNNIFKTMSLAN